MPPPGDRKPQEKEPTGDNSSERLPFRPPFQDPEQHEPGPNLVSGGTDQSAPTSQNASRRTSGETKAQKEKHRVRFGLEAAAKEKEGLRKPTPTSRSRSGTQNRPDSGGGIGGITGSRSGSRSPNIWHGASPPKAMSIQRNNGPQMLSDAKDITESPTAKSPVRRSSRGMFSTTPNELLSDDDETEDRAEYEAQNARSRAERLSRSLDPNRKSRSAPGSRARSPETTAPSTPLFDMSSTTIPKDLTNLIPMHELQNRRKKFGIADESETEDEDEDTKLNKKGPGHRSRFTTVIKDLIRTHQDKDLRALGRTRDIEQGLASGQVTPDHERNDPDYVPKPREFKGGVLAALLKLYEVKPDIATDAATERREDSVSTAAGTPAITPSGSPTISPPASGTATPRRKVPKWHDKGLHSNHQSTNSLTSLINYSTVLANPGSGVDAQRPPLAPRPRSTGTIDTLKSFAKNKQRKKKESSTIHIQVHIEEIVARQKYLVKSCRALMKYGAPTHRIEEYMNKSARFLGIEGQFLYLPGCMIISFDDPHTHTTEVKLVKQDIDSNLGKLIDIHNVYKNVIHEQLNVQEASEALDAIAVQKPRYNFYWRIFFYGCAAATVGPYAFGARPIDMPVAFVLGSLLGFMQLCLAERSDLFRNGWEITATMITSFSARALGSISYNGSPLFCFSALAQSSIALILPGYIVLSGALEVSSHNIVAGVVRIGYAVVYSLLLGFGITIGTTLAGGIIPHANSEVTCRNPTDGYDKWFYVPFFTFFLILVNQGKWRQVGPMLFISSVGYIVNYYATLRFPTYTPLASVLGALTIGILANLYSIWFHGMSAAAILPAIFVQVPSGLAASGSLISGVTTADQIFSNSTTAVKDTATSSLPAAIATATTSGGTTTILDPSSTFSTLSLSIVQIAIAIGTGLIWSSVICYALPNLLGWKIKKKGSALFNF